jgi:multidrug resistance efflux pump
MVKYVHVQDGQTVRQDEPLITVDNLSISQEIEQTDDELTLAQAELRSKVSELKWAMSRHDELDVRATTEYFELWGRLLDERATLAELAAKYERATELRRADSVTEESFEESHYRWKGQQDKVAKLAQAVEEMKKSAKVTTILDSGSDQLAPSLAKIDMLAGKRARLRQQLASGELRAPTNGVVLRRWKFVGEKCGMDDPAITVVEESSLQIVLYFRQSSSWMPSVGENVSVEVPPNSLTVLCRVERIGSGYEVPTSSTSKESTSARTVAGRAPNWHMLPNVCAAPLSLHRGKLPCVT